MQFNKHTYLNGFTFIVIILALGRCGYDYTHKNDAAAPADSVATVDGKVPVAKMNYEFSNPPSFKSIKDMPHRVYSVPDFSNTFPDENDVQLIAADENGVRPPKNRQEAEHRMEDLVFVGANPYFYIDNLKQSIPYLVPKRIRSNRSREDSSSAFMKDSSTVISSSTDVKVVWRQWSLQ